jgi:hypothetical protein
VGWSQIWKYMQQKYRVRKVTKTFINHAIAYKWVLRWLAWRQCYMYTKTFMMKNRQF